MDIINSNTEKFVKDLNEVQDYERMEQRHKVFIIQIMKESFLELAPVSIISCRVPSCIALFINVRLGEVRLG